MYAVYRATNAWIISFFYLYQISFCDLNNYKILKLNPIDYWKHFFGMLDNRSPSSVFTENIAGVKR